MEQKSINVGLAVRFVDSLGVEYQALLTEVHGEGLLPPTEGYPPPCVNLLHVSGDEAKRDGYGRQIERLTSVPHKDGTSAHGFYWTEL